MSVETLEKPEARTAPPKRWKNWWRIDCDGHGRCSTCGRKELLSTGDVWSTCCRTFPDHDVAVTHAARVLERLGDVQTYLGAFPEGERP